MSNIKSKHDRDLVILNFIYEAARKRCHREKVPFAPSLGWLEENFREQLDRYGLHTLYTRVFNDCAEWRDFYLKEE